MFEIRILEQQYDMHDPESKTKFYNAVAEKLCTFGEKLERDNYIAAVADKYMIGIEDLRSWSTSMVQRSAWRQAETSCA